MSQFYDGTRLLSLMDINGDKPEIYAVTSNRSAGKTVYFSRLLVNKFKKGEGKFAILYRFNYELDDCADKFFKEIKELFFQDDIMRSERRADGVYHELFLNDVPCGYAISLNNADQVKKMSHFFSDVERMLFDEFQSETNHYCNDEITKFISIHNSIARGGGKQVRYLPVYMCANPVSLLNPYFAEWNVASRIQADTKFVRGEGLVLEQGFNESASLRQQQSSFNRAFSRNKYIEYSAQAVYLNDNKSFIEKPKGRSAYFITLKYKGKEYAIREYPDLSIFYCDDNVDKTFKAKISVTTDDHQINYVMLKRSDLLISNLRYFFERGCFRFKDLNCKEAVLCALSYH